MRKRFTIQLLLCLCAFVPAFAQTQLSNLPSVYINTLNNQSIYKNVYVDCTMTYIDGDSTAVYDAMSIRGRGNSTWGLAKKPYRIKFDESTKFLGKGYAKSKSWVFLANHGDKSLIRNAVTFEMGDFLDMPFNPAVRFVDFTLNGNFQGNYQITDQVKVDGHRVEVMEQDDPLTETSNITGGYLFEVDGFGGSEPVNFRTKKNIIISMKYPEDDVITTEQVNYIQSYVQEFETALFSANFTDPETGYRAYVDSATLINWYIATELSANVDGFYSTFMYKEQDDPKLYFGPLWDYDIAYNNCNRTGDVTNRTMIDAGFGSNLSKIWVIQMIKDNWFNKAVNDRWKEVIANGLEDHLFHYIDSMANLLQRSQTLNYQKWSISSRAYNEIYLYSTYQEYIDQLKQFITEHIVFLTTTFANRVKDEEVEPEPDPTGDVFQTSDYYYLITNRGCGNALDVDSEGVDVGDLIILYNSTFDRYSQHWEIVKVGEHFQVINRLSGLALNDPTAVIGEISTQLDLALPDATDDRQLWDIVVANTEGYYNFINVFSQNVINNSGGGSANGNKVVSYTNDSRNGVSNNRQWVIEAQEKLPEPEVEDTLFAVLPDETALDVVTWTGDEPGNDDVTEPTGMAMPTFDYAVMYNEELQVIRFSTEDYSKLEQTSATLYNTFGEAVLTFTADKEQSIAHLPNGLYLLRWEVEGIIKVIKFMKK